MKKIFMASYALKLAALIWLIFAIDLILPIDLNRFGIYPRSLSGLTGIAFAPWLHHSIFHIVSNTVPLIILGSLLQLYGARVFINVTIISALISGLGVWVFSSPAITVGISGVVFGYWGFLLAAGVILRSFKSIAIAVVVGVLYSALLLSLLKVSYGISWSGHFFGALGGVIAAYLLKTTITNQSK